VALAVVADPELAGEGGRGTLQVVQVEARVFGDPPERAATELGRGDYPEHCDGAGGDDPGSGPMPEVDVRCPVEERAHGIREAVGAVRLLGPVEAFEHLFEGEFLDPVAGRVDVGVGVVLVEGGLQAWVSWRL
jgi:hypothetical protein